MIALAKIYFAVKTRKQEISEEEKDYIMVKMLKR